MWLLVILAVLFLIVMFLVAAAAVIALAINVAAHLFPILLILAGVWLIVRALRGPDQHRRHARQHQRRRNGTMRSPSPDPSSQAGRRPKHPHADRRPSDEMTSARRPAGPPRRELPPDVAALADEIHHKAKMLLGYADRFSPFSHDLYVVRQTADEYLPRTVAAYLAVPGTDDPVIGPSGKTALQELREQLRLLDSRLDAIIQSLQRNDLDRLLANRRFLEERFGEGDDLGAGLPNIEEARRQRGVA